MFAAAVSACQGGAWRLLVCLPQPGCRPGGPLVSSQSPAEEHPRRSDLGAVGDTDTRRVTSPYPLGAARTTRLNGASIQVPPTTPSYSANSRFIPAFDVLDAPDPPDRYRFGRVCRWLHRGQNGAIWMYGIIGCGCREPHPRHATRRYSLIRPPTRACLVTRYCGVDESWSCGGAFTMVEQLPVQRGAADAEVGGDLFGDSAVPDLLGGSGTQPDFVGHDRRDASR